MSGKDKDIGIGIQLLGLLAIFLVVYLFLVLPETKKAPYPVVQTEVSVQQGKTPDQIARKTGKSCGTVVVTVNGEKFTGEMKTVNYQDEKGVYNRRIVKIFFPESVYKVTPWIAGDKTNTSLDLDPLWQNVNDACLK